MPPKANKYILEKMLIVMTFHLCPMVAKLIMFSSVSIWVQPFFSDISIKNIYNAVNDIYIYIYIYIYKN